MPKTDPGADTKTPPDPKDSKVDDGQAKKFDQADVDRIVSDRLKRENIAELKDKASKFDAAEKARKSDDETTRERIGALEEQLRDERHDKARLRIAGERKISAKDAELFLTGADESEMVAQAEALVALSKAVAVVDTHAGRQSGDTSDDGMREFTRNLFGADS